jgi:hypothetical protein
VAAIRAKLPVEINKAVRDIQCHEAVVTPPNPPPVNPQCQGQEELRAKASADFNNNNFGVAEKEFEQLYRCGDGSALAQAFMSACNAQQFDKAKQLFVKLQPAQKTPLKQICMRSGVDPEKP